MTLREAFWMGALFGILLNALIRGVMDIVAEWRQEQAKGKT